MERRLILALTLGVGVILLSNVLFPPAPPAPRSLVPEAATTTGPNAVPPSAVPLPAAAAPTGGAAPATQPATQPAAQPAGPAAPEEIVAVTTPKAVYRLSTRGAAMVGAMLPDYKMLTAKGATGPVELAMPAVPLFSYALVTAGDTLPLDRTSFTARREADATGEAVLFTGTVPTRVGPASVEIGYRFLAGDAQAYRARVSARVGGVAGPAFLLVQLPDGLAQTEADAAEAATHLAFAWHTRGGSASLLPFAKLDPGERTLTPGPHVWAVAKSKYFLVGALGASDQETPFLEASFTGGVRTGKLATTAHARLVTQLAGGAAAWEIFVGPQEWKRLLAVGRDFENANPYGGFLQGVVQPFATIVMRILLWIKGATQLNYGWVLVLFGVVIRLVLWPLNQSAMRTSIRMQRVSPELQAVQQKHKGDPQRMQQELMKVYAEHGLSPFSAFSGCLPMLLPLPVLFALFFVFQNTIEFRGVSFLWLPDISMKDPYYIIPIAMGATMFLMSWIGTRNAPPNPQAAMMSWLMPVVFTVLFLNFASGLNLYYTVQNLAALPQQWLLANERGKASTTKRLT